MAGEVNGHKNACSAATAKNETLIFPIIKKEAYMGESVYYCEKCQEL